MAIVGGQLRRRDFARGFSTLVCHQLIWLQFLLAIAFHP